MSDRAVRCPEVRPRRGRNTCVLYGGPVQDGGRPRRRVRCVQGTSSGPTGTIKGPPTWSVLREFCGRCRDKTVKTGACVRSRLRGWRIVAMGRRGRTGGLRGNGGSATIRDIGCRDGRVDALSDRVRFGVDRMCSRRPRISPAGRARGAHSGCGALLAVHRRLRSVRLGWRRTVHMPCLGVKTGCGQGPGWGSQPVARASSTSRNGRVPT